MFETLRGHKVDGVVLDTPAAEYYTAMATPACDLFTGKQVA
jgi:ABC-type amino acid transport substrate-binding protein